MIRNHFTQKEGEGETEAEMCGTSERNSGVAGASLILTQVGARFRALADYASRCAISCVFSITV